MAVPDDWISTFLATRGPQAQTLAGSLNPVAEMERPGVPGYQIPLMLEEGGYAYPGFGIDPELQRTGWNNPSPGALSPVGFDWSQITTDPNSAMNAMRAAQGGSGGPNNSMLAALVARFGPQVVKYLADRLKGGSDQQQPQEQPQEPAGTDANGNPAGGDAQAPEGGSPTSQANAPTDADGNPVSGQGSSSNDGPTVGAPAPIPPTDPMGNLLQGPGTPSVSLPMQELGHDVMPPGAQVDLNGNLMAGTPSESASQLASISTEDQLLASPRAYLSGMDFTSPEVGSGGAAAAPAGVGYDAPATVDIGGSVGTSPVPDLPSGPPPQVNVEALPGGGGDFTGVSSGGGMPGGDFGAGAGSGALNIAGDPVVGWLGDNFGSAGQMLGSGLAMAPFSMVGGQWGKAIASMFSGNDFQANPYTSMGGAPVGAAIGTAIMPGIGTAIMPGIGTIIGAFIGALAGNLIGANAKHPQSFIGGGVTIGDDGRAHLSLSEPGAHDGGNAGTAARLRNVLDGYLNLRAQAEGMSWNPNQAGAYNFLTGTYEDQLFFRAGHTNPITGETDPTMQSVGNQQSPGAFFGNHLWDFELDPQHAAALRAAGQYDKEGGLASTIYGDMVNKGVLMPTASVPTWADVNAARTDYSTWRNAHSRTVDSPTGGENFEVRQSTQYDMPWGYTEPGDSGADWRTGGDPTWNDYEGFRNSEAYQQLRGSGNYSAESVAQLAPTAGDTARVTQAAESFEQRHPELQSNRTENFAGGG